MELVCWKCNFRKDMKTKIASWDQIPSIDGLKIDWDYEPENALGKRAWVRIGKADLRSFLTVESMPVKIVTRNIDKTGHLVDISIGGLALLLDTNLPDGQLTRIGISLGKRKIISRAIVRNVSSSKGKHRIGMEFVDLEKNDASFIASLISSKMYKI